MPTEGVKEAEKMDTRKRRQRDPSSPACRKDPRGGNFGRSGAPSGALLAADGRSGAWFRALLAAGMVSLGIVLGASDGRSGAPFGALLAAGMIFQGSFFG